MLEVIIRYLDALGAGGLFIAVFIEAMGLPFPGGIMVILAGVLSSQGKLPAMLAFGAAVAGFSFGAVTAFYLGRYVGKPVIERYGKYVHITPQAFDQAQMWMKRSAAAFILAGRFIPLVSNLTPYMAGVSRLGWGRFLIYNTIFALVWSAFNIYLGMFFGHNWQRIAASSQSKIAAAAVAVLVLYFFIRYKFFKHR